VLTPDGVPAWGRRPARVDSTLVKALARAHRWQKLLDRTSYASVEELAKAERINPSYLARVLRPTLLAPDIVECILNRSCAHSVTLHRLMKPFPLKWREQRML
jgi:hypothetical protein